MVKASYSCCHAVVSVTEPQTPANISSANVDVATTKIRMKLSRLTGSSGSDDGSEASSSQRAVTMECYQANS